ncbi:MAG: BolA family transcriptional regulator [Alphaproteobacteria bacterium]|nr:BolA family transcriptional regulator [Alphaproteobacteria bacterium]
MTLKTRIEEKLRQTFSPLYLRVEDDSYQHVGHKNYKPGAESHFSVRLVSDAFSGIPRVQRHQKIYACLEDEIKNGVHALSLQTLSPEEAEALNEQA